MRGLGNRRLRAGNSTRAACWPDHRGRSTRDHAVDPLFDVGQIALHVSQQTHHLADLPTQPERSTSEPITVMKKRTSSEV